MSQHPMLLVGRDGRVHGANEPATDRLGGSRGWGCARVVGATTGRGGAICTTGCAKSLIESGGVRVEPEARIRGQTSQLVCTCLGDFVAVQLLEPPPEGVEASLTPRELEVLGLVARGLTSTRIAERLGLRFSTVRTHIEHLREKLGAASRAEAVAIALKAGLLEPKTD